MKPNTWAVDEKIKVVIDINKNFPTVKKGCEHFGISLASYYSWSAKFAGRNEGKYLYTKIGNVKWT